MRNNGVVGRTLSVSVLILAALVSCPRSHGKKRLEIAASKTGIKVTVLNSGEFTIRARLADWEFAGAVGRPLTGLQKQHGKDSIGPYDETVFEWSDEGRHRGAIRLYEDKPVVLFASKAASECRNTKAFPAFQKIPKTLSLSYRGTFGHYVLGEFAPDSPWVGFDTHANAYVLSAASNFLVASLRTVNGETRAGIDPEIPTIPAGFTQKTILVIEHGVNEAFETWGRALTSLSGKQRPANDADITLKYLGYWTDNGASYYYKYEPLLGYQGTLLGVRDDFIRTGIPLGYMQLDSWFYPKGAQRRWNAADGIYEYLASPELFPDGLEAFQKKLGLPLVTHARWIDPSSPYHQRYAMSRNVVTDPAYWQRTAQYLRRAGVQVYEQDWLDDKALPALNLQDRAAFVDNMAAACRAQQLTMQYCMPLPRHYLQTVNYDQLTTIRTSDDRFERGKWDSFLYGARLASALGVWPWADVFMSKETENVLLATLSGGPVGIGDAIGKLDRRNLMRVVRADGVIVKPDATLAPLDGIFIQDATAAGPMIAATYTDFGKLRAWYIAGYSRGTSTASPAFTPSSLGMRGRWVALDFLGGTARLIAATDKLALPQHDRFGYTILAPVGKSGLALLGDADQFVTLGRQRIRSLSDSGHIETTVAFATGEAERTLFGYAPLAPRVSAREGHAQLASYDAGARIFRIKVRPAPDGTAVVIISASASSGAKGKGPAK